MYEIVFMAVTAAAFAGAVALFRDSLKAPEGFEDHGLCQTTSD